MLSGFPHFDTNKTKGKNTLLCFQSLPKYHYQHNQASQTLRIPLTLGTELQLTDILHET